MSVAKPVDGWPLILCGPMLRRVGYEGSANAREWRATVFVALSAPRMVMLSLHMGADPGAPSIASANEPTFALGKQLHVSVLTVKIPSPDFSQVYGYNLTFSPAQFSTGFEPIVDPLQGMTMDLQSEASLGYESGKLPTFSLPPEEVHDLNILHASCRMAHGEGEDMFPVMDEVIGSLRHSAKDRPHHLFLTGDQIYADDVSPVLLAIVRETASILLGGKEDFPSSRAGDAFVKVDTFGPHGRKNLVREEGRLTSSESDNHLLGLGEYYAMYLLMWSDSLWPEMLPGAGTIFPNEGLGPKLEKLTSLCDAHLLALKKFRKGLPAVRRLLANVPTFMTPDDHEVTDDWNLCRPWVNQVHGSRVGTRIVQNALSAFAVFQGWGNDPEQFAVNTPGRELLNALQRWARGMKMNGMNDPQPQDEGVLRRALNLPPYYFDSSGPFDAYRLRWDYEVRFANHRVIALDTRTQRGFPNGDGWLAAKLLSKEAMKRQIIDRRDREQFELNLLVSPTPVIGHTLQEWALATAVGTLQSFSGGSVSTSEARRPPIVHFTPSPTLWNVLLAMGLQYAVPIRVWRNLEEREKQLVQFVDYEAWSYNAATFEGLLHELGKFKRVVILSGDVHTAFTCSMAYWDNRGGGTPRVSRIVQCTSSGMKREEWKTRALGRISDSRRLKLTDLWHLATDPDSFFEFMGDFSEPVRMRFFGWSNSVKIRDGGKTFTVSGAPAVFQPIGAVQIVDPPKWKYVLTFSKDNLQIESRYTPLAGRRTIPDGVSEIVKKRAVAWDHRRSAQLDQMRHTVGYNNFGRVTFHRDSPNPGMPDDVLRRVEHELWFRMPEADRAPGPYTIHNAEFNIPTTDAPFELAGDLPPLGDWAELLSFRLSDDLVKYVRDERRMSVQYVENGRGDVSLDLYAIKVAKLPQNMTAQSILDTILSLCFADFIPQGMAKFKPLDHQKDGERLKLSPPPAPPGWMMGSPIRAVISIELAAFGPLVLEKGSVLVSHYHRPSTLTPGSASRFRFTTLFAPADGSHPVSGNRDFGFIALDNHQYLFYTRGADRLTSVLEQAVAPSAFSRADALWKAYLAGIRTFMTDNRGEVAADEIAIAERYDWDLVKSRFFSPRNWR